MFGSTQPRSTEGFMDYQWDTNGGPRDPTSPFPQASRHQSISGSALDDVKQCGS